jgi:beta-glucosidase
VTEGTSFPPGFLWGTATAAHQIEGGNWNNDWWRFEHAASTPCAEPSGDACDSWHRYEEDAHLVAALGFGSYRFSVEWSRIEPEKGEFSRAAIDHYVRQCEALRERGVAPVVTFHHFTSPRWVADEGGWESPQVVDRFGKFCEVTSAALGPYMARACTINEPNIVGWCGWILGVFPPGVRKDSDTRRRVNANFVGAHRRAVEAIRAAAPTVPVGLTLAMSDYVAVDGGEERLDRIRLRMEDEFLAATEGDDFVGVQAYSRSRIGPQGQLGPEAGVPVLTMGYEYWPEALEGTLRRAHEVTGGRIPLIVTENGIGTDDDEQRMRFVHTSLSGVLRALSDGIDVRGYTYWSLLDNFEWAFGYRPHFGLVAVNRETFVRSPKPSAHWLGGVAGANRLLPLPDGVTQGAG